MKIISGPHGSGKSTFLYERARTALAQRRRVSYVTLPHARAHALRKLAKHGGGGIGLEVLHFQQLYTRILAQAGRLNTPVDLMQRVALVGRALGHLMGAVPSPGEAGLFARAIAELKRYGLSPEQLPAGIDPEVDRLREVYERYEALKGDAQDPDDRRNLAGSLVTEQKPKDLDLLLVDGFRELAPAEVSFLEKLSASGIEVLVTIPEPIPGHPSTETFEDPRVRRDYFVHANPIEEARWILKKAKSLVLDGADPNDIAIIVPDALLPVYLLYSGDAGIPVNDESRRSLQDLPEGRLLHSLLTLPDNPDPSVLQHVPGLERLAEAVFLAGVSGSEAISKLAEETGHLAELENLVSTMEPHGEPDEWVRGVISRFPELAQSPWNESLAAAGFEAINLLGESAGKNPEVLRTWWAAMLGFVNVRQRAHPGITITTPNMLGGRRYDHAFVAYAVAGAYQAHAGEDYFLADATPFRVHWEDAFAKAGLPFRIRNQTNSLWAEVAASGAHTTISYPRASAGGKLEPEPGIFNEAQASLATPLPPASKIEVDFPETPLELPRTGPVPLVSDVPAEDLRRFQECGWKYWLQKLGVRAKDSSPPAWVEALNTLAEQKRNGKELDPTLLQTLGFKPDPEWEYHFWPTTELEGIMIRTHALAINSRNSLAAILHFTVKPLGKADKEGARSIIRKRWSEYLMAYKLLKDGYTVMIMVKPAGDGSVKAYDMNPSDLDRPQKWPAKTLTEKLALAKETKTRIPHSRLHPAANPGSCRACPYRDVCRQAN